MRSCREGVPKGDTENAERLERKRACQRRYVQRHREKINERLRHRRQTDSAYRERTQAVRRDYYQRHKEEIREHCRQKWRTDPEYRAKSHARSLVANRKKRFKEVYGITLADYEKMFARQGGACAICKKTELTLCVDHCHRTGEVRGLLCRRCNTALGCCKDDPDILLAAVAYLRSWRDQQREACGTDPPIEPALHAGLKADPTVV